MAENFYNLVDRIYEENNFPGLQKLIKLVKTEHPEIKNSFVQAFLNERKEHQLIQKQIKTEHQGSLVADFENEIWQMDIFILEKYYESNNGYKYILACIDIFTRKAYVFPMKRKTSDAVASALQVILMENKAKPIVIMSDNDGAYHGKEFQKILQENNILLNESIVGDHNYLGIIDNFAKRIKLILTKIFLRSNSTRWFDKIQTIVDVYNKTNHSSLANLSPNQASQPQNRQIIVEINNAKKMANLRTSDLEPGDKVRKYIAHKLSKGTEPSWSDEVYSVVRTNKMTIYVKDDAGNDYAFKRSMLLKVPRTTQSTETNIIKRTPKYN